VVLGWKRCLNTVCSNNWLLQGIRIEGTGVVGHDNVVRRTESGGVQGETAFIIIINHLCA